jgi:hypothetical protein
MPPKISSSALALALFLGGVFGPVEVLADATTEPRVQQSDLVYQGAFKLPGGNFGMSYGTFEYAGGFVGGNVYDDPTHGKTLFITGYLSAGYVSQTASVAQVKIPAALADPNIVGDNGLPTATIVQGFDDPSNGRQAQALGVAGNGFGNMIVYNGKLIGTAAAAYDATCSQSKSAWVSPIDFTQKSQASGPYGFDSPVGPRFLGGGYMALVPPEWQALLGGKVVSGNGPWSIISCGSPGPALHVIDADALVAQPATSTPIDSIPLVYYEDGLRSSLGEWNSNLPGQVIDGKIVPSITVTDPHGRGNFTFAYEDNAMRVNGVLFPDGTRSVLFFGQKGMGPYCYGDGGASGGDCYDPDRIGKGDHAYPYTEFVWAYDATDLLAAKNGAKNPWEVLPYAGWAFKVFGDGDGGGRTPGCRGMRRPGAPMSWSPARRASVFRP